MGEGTRVLYVEHVVELPEGKQLFTPWSCEVSGVELATVHDAVATAREAATFRFPEAIRVEHVVTRIHTTEQHRVFERRRGTDWWLALGRRLAREASSRA